MTTVEVGQAGRVTWYTEARALSQEDRALVEALRAYPFVRRIEVFAPVDGRVGLAVEAEALLPGLLAPDPGWGLLAVRIDRQLSDLPVDLGPVLERWADRIPHGPDWQADRERGGRWEEGAIPNAVLGDWHGQLGAEYRQHVAMCWPHLTDPRQYLGTLGMGRAFVGLFADAESCVWLIVRSGARTIGQWIAKQVVVATQEAMRQWFLEAPPALVYLPPEVVQYGRIWRAMAWMAHFAAVNRMVIADRAIGALRELLPRPTAVYKQWFVDQPQVSVRQGQWFVHRADVVRAEGATRIVLGSDPAGVWLIQAGAGGQETSVSVLPEQLAGHATPAGWRATLRPLLALTGAGPA